MKWLIDSWGESVEVYYAKLKLAPIGVPQFPTKIERQGVKTLVVFWLMWYYLLGVHKCLFNVCMKCFCLNFFLTKSQKQIVKAAVISNVISVCLSECVSYYKQQSALTWIGDYLVGAKWYLFQGLLVLSLAEGKNVMEVAPDVSLSYPPEFQDFLDK